MATGDKTYVADKPTLDAINSKIGTTTDTPSSSATTGSVFAKLNYLVSQIRDYLSSIFTYVSRIGNPADTGGSTTTGTVMGKLNSLQNNGAIKSIQRGTGIISFTAEFSTIPLLNINISEIVPSKTTVAVWGIGSPFNNATILGLIAPYSVQSNSLTVCFTGKPYSGNSTTITFAYEITEYK